MMKKDPQDHLPFGKRIRKHDLQAAFDFLFILCMLVFSAIWAVRTYLHTAPYVDPERYPISGIDVSAHNGMMNLDAAAASGIRFIFIKATEGGDFRDENFRINYDKARHAGLKIGAYHFFRFNTDGVEQALNLLSVIGDRNLDLGIAVDVEKHGNPDVPLDSIEMRLRDMSEFLNLKGYRVTYYASRDGYYDYIKPGFEGFPLWVCSFSSTPILTDWTFWQYDHHGRVAGIRGDVDLDTFYGNEQEWEDWLNRNAIDRRNADKKNL